MTNVNYNKKIKMVQFTQLKNAVRCSRQFLRIFILKF